MLLRSGLKMKITRPHGRASIALAVTLAATTMLVGGCFEFDVPEPSATVSPMTSVMRPAKAPNCPLRISLRKIEIRSSRRQSAKSRYCLPPSRIQARP